MNSLYSQPSSLQIRLPLLERSEQADAFSMEGGTKQAKKKKSCSKKQKYKDVKRNKKMQYKKFGKKRKIYRLQKICKNIVRGSIVLCLSAYLYSVNDNRFEEKNCCRVIEEGYNHLLEQEDVLNSTKINQSFDFFEEKGLCNRNVICYETVYNRIVLQLIWDMTIIWLIYKVLKADMGFRCTCSPLISSIVQGIMALTRVVIFCYNFLWCIFPLLFWNCIYTYIVVYDYLVYGRERKDEGNQKINSDRIDKYIHLLVLIFWTVQIILWTSLPFIIIYCCVVLRRKSDFRKGWSRRFDLAMLNLLRIFLGTSRLMIVNFERHSELLDNLEDDANQQIDKRDFLSEDFSTNTPENQAIAKSAIITNRQKLEQFIERSSRQKSVHKFKFLEGRDCPICLATFHDDDIVIQLSCHKFHVYHETCLNEMLSYPEIESKCLMCRNCILNHEIIDADLVD